MDELQITTCQYIIIENVDYCKIVPITEQQSRLFSKNVILFGFEGVKLEEIKKKR